MFGIVASTALTLYSPVCGCEQGHLAEAEHMDDVGAIDGKMLLAAEQKLLVGVVKNQPGPGRSCEVCQPL